MLQALPHRVWTARSHRASVRSRCPTALTLRSKAIYIMPTSPQDQILTLLSRDDSCIIAISKHTLILPLISPPFFYLFIYPSNPDTQHLYSKYIFHLPTPPHHHNGQIHLQLPKIPHPQIPPQTLGRRTHATRPETHPRHQTSLRWRKRRRKGKMPSQWRGHLYPPPGRLPRVQKGVHGAPAMFLCEGGGCDDEKAGSGRCEWEWEGEAEGVERPGC